MIPKIAGIESVEQDQSEDDEVTEKRSIAAAPAAMNAARMTSAPAIPSSSAFS